MAMAIAALVQGDSLWVVQIPSADIYTIQEVSRILGTAAPMVYGYINKGRLPAYILDGVKHVKHSDLVSFAVHRRQLRRSIAAKIKPQRIVPHQKGDPSIRKDFSIPLEYVDE